MSRVLNLTIFFVYFVTKQAVVARSVSLRRPAALPAYKILFHYRIYGAPAEYPETPHEGRARSVRAADGDRPRCSIDIAGERFSDRTNISCELLPALLNFVVAENGSDVYFLSYPLADDTNATLNLTYAFVSPSTELKMKCALWYNTSAEVFRSELPCERSPAPPPAARPALRYLTVWEVYECLKTRIWLLLTMMMLFAYLCRRGIYSCFCRRCCCKSTKTDVIISFTDKRPNAVKAVRYYRM